MREGNIINRKKGIMILTVYKVISDTPILKRSCRSFHLRFSRFNSFYSKYGSAFKFLRAANNFDKFLPASIQLETESVFKLYNGIIHYLGWGYKFTPHSKRTSQNFRKNMRSISYMDGSEFSRSGLAWITRFENIRPLAEISRFSRRYYRSIE